MQNLGIQQIALKNYHLEILEFYNEIVKKMGMKSFHDIIKSYQSNLEEIRGKFEEISKSKLILQDTLKSDLEVEVVKGSIEKLFYFNISD